MSEYTPGPWRVTRYSTPKTEQVIVQGPAHNVARLNIAGRDYNALDTDAGLIAAAPDLLAALEAVIDEDRLIEFARRCQQYPAEPPLNFFESVFPEVAAAIARATGRDAAVED